MDASRHTIKERTAHHVRELVLVWFYLWVIFGLLEVHKSMILAEYHINFAYHGFALINAFGLSKIILVARDPLAKRLNEAPLIYLTFLKSALLTVMLAAFKLLEEGAISLYRGESFQAGIADLGGGTLKGFLTLALLVFVLLIPFVGLDELRRVLGEREMAQLFFRKRIAAQRHSLRNAE